MLEPLHDRLREIAEGPHSEHDKIFFMLKATKARDGRLATLLASQEAEIERLSALVTERERLRADLAAANHEVTMLVSWAAAAGGEPDLLLSEFERLSAKNEKLETVLAATEQPLMHASQCLDGIVSMDDEDQGKDEGSATCQAVKKTVDRALKNVRAALGPAETGGGQP